MPSASASPERLVAQNRRARHDYDILDTLEAGLVLAGTEVKSLRNGKASLQEAYATVENGEAWVRQLHIPPYEQGNRWNLDPVRPRKLLLHRRELEKLARAVAQKGLT
ncbi:MAG TPA: SsrA-binding protein SmpB, partial [Candidatus Eisenbacteria bacterium]|nr:SsrA-binding protein SmpB [Candidatus Eisenbacteria bacterium]